MIEFLCPEGHKIRCPEEQAGRPAKCPRCGVRFRIPTLAELGLEPETIEPEIATPPGPADPEGAVQDLPEPELQHESKIGRSGGSGKGNGPSTAVHGDSAPAKEAQIEFLCPNGHHLHGPSSLQGRPGECPECGSRFRIPLIDQPDEPPASDVSLGSGIGSDIGSGEFGEAIESGPPGLSLDLLQVLEEARLSGSSRVGGGVPSGEDIAPSAARPGVHPLGKLFADLWAAKDESSRVEVHLESGSVLLPDGYIKSLSQYGHAVLVGVEPDGSSTLTVVPWESVARIIVRGVKQPPGEVLR